MTQVYPETTQKFTCFEDVIEETGWGLYFRYLIAIGCLISFSHASQILSLPLGLPFSTCDTVITERVIMNVYIYYICGKFLGGLILNCAVDYYGRKKIILFTLVTSFVSLFTCAFTNTYFLIIMAGFTLGSCLESLMCATKVTIAEMLTCNRRSYYLVLCDICWTFGYMVVAVSSIFMVTTQERDRQGVDMKLGLWRLIFAFTGGFSLLLACFSSLMEESPRYLLHNKKNYLALVLIKQYFTINNSMYGDNLQIKESDISNIIEDYKLMYFPEPHSCTLQVQRLLTRMTMAIIFVFRKRFILSTLLLMLMNVMLFFGLYNSHVFLTNLIHSSEINETFHGILDLHLIRPTNELCIFKVDYEIYKNFLILGGNVFLGKLLLLIIITRTGSKIPMCASCVICCISFLLFNVVNNVELHIVFSCLIVATYGVIESIVYIKTIELYPTAVRCTAMSVTRFIGLSLFLIFLHDRDIPVNVLIWLNAGLLTGAAILSCLLDDLTGKPMVE